MIPKRRKRARMGVRQEERVRCKPHLQWVRGNECAAYALDLNEHCAGKVEAHHVRREGEGTTGKKPGDDACVSLCSRHHELGHRIGWKSFEARYKVDLTKIAADLWRTSPHRRAYEKKAMAQADTALRDAAERYMDEIGERIDDA